MALVHCNPVIEGFSKKSGNLVFFISRGKCFVRRHVIPRNPRTERQQFGRAAFAEAVRLWQELPEYKKAQCSCKARMRRTSGYNLFISRFLRDAWARASGVPSLSFLFPLSIPLRFSCVAGISAPSNREFEPILDEYGRARAQPIPYA